MFVGLVPRWRRRVEEAGALEHMIIVAARSDEVVDQTRAKSACAMVKHFRQNGQACAAIYDELNEECLRAPPDVVVAAPGCGEAYLVTCRRTRAVSKWWLS